jgi:hypothetical protein
MTRKPLTGADFVLIVLVAVTLLPIVGVVAAFVLFGYGTPASIN